MKWEGHIARPQIADTKTSPKKVGLRRYGSLAHGASWVLSPKISCVRGRQVNHCINQ